MDADYFLTVANQTLWVLALASAPILVPALLAGLILGMVQAATSINEQTLSFVPKLLMVGACLALFGGAMVWLPRTSTPIAPDSAIRAGSGTPTLPNTGATTNAAPTRTITNTSAQSWGSIERPRPSTLVFRHAGLDPA